MSTSMNVSYEDATVARLHSPRRDKDRDEAARQGRKARTAELEKIRQKEALEETRLAETTESEQEKLSKLEAKYQDCFLDESKTRDTIGLKSEINLRKERVTKLEADVGKLHQDLGAIDAELQQIKVTERQAIEDEEVSDILERDGNRALDLIEGIVQSLQRLRAISVRARYELPLGRSASNAKALDDLSENIRKSFQILVLQRVLFGHTQELGLYLVKQQWP